MVELAITDNSVTNGNIRADGCNSLLSRLSDCGSVVNGLVRITNVATNTVVLQEAFRTNNSGGGGDHGIIALTKQADCSGSYCCLDVSNWYVAEHNENDVPHAFDSVCKYSNQLLMLLVGTLRMVLRWQ